MTATDVRERAILDALFGSGSPATWHVGLSLTTPNDDGTNFVEPTAGAYARVAKTNNVTNFPAASTTAGVTTKGIGTAITWTTPTATWGQILAVGFFTASTGGTPELWQPLDGPITVQTGNTPVEFAVGALLIPCD